jgi:hypothetical protein
LRIWFAGFCDYYHYSNPQKNLPERSPYTEFGKNLITDFDEEEINKLYNFFAYCLSFYLQVREKIEPPLDLIDRRNLQGSMTDDFILWADIFFGMNSSGNYPNLNVTINKEETRKSFLQSIGLTTQDKESKFWKMALFKKCLMNYAEYANPKLVFNPADLMKTESEKKQNDIRVYENGADTYCFHYRTINFIKGKTAPL